MHAGSSELLVCMTVQVLELMDQLDSQVTSIFNTGSLHFLPVQTGFLKVPPPDNLVCCSFN